MNTINEDFWSSPPWGTGEKKYRMGLKPIEIDSWLDRTPNKKLIEHKKNLFSKSYEKVVATTACSKDAQKHLGEIFGIQKTICNNYIFASITIIPYLRSKYVLY